MVVCVVCALTLLVGWQKWQLACKRNPCCLSWTYLLEQVKEENWGDLLTQVCPENGHKNRMGRSVIKLGHRWQYVLDWVSAFVYFVCHVLNHFEVGHYFIILVFWHITESIRYFTTLKCILQCFLLIPCCVHWKTLSKMVRRMRVILTFLMIQSIRLIFRYAVFSPFYYI